MYYVNVQTTSGYILCEVKISIVNRLLPKGGSYSLSVIFDIYSDHCKRILNEIILKWVIDTGIVDLNTTNINNGFHYLVR